MHRRPGLADDPGAGKTIMAGLYIKELLLRADLHRCLIVAPSAWWISLRSPLRGGPFRAENGGPVAC